MWHLKKTVVNQSDLMTLSSNSNISKSSDAERSIFYYISGHGFGHATRSLEVIRAIRSCRPEIPIHIRSWASSSIFEQKISNIDVNYTKLDIGVIQADGISMNIPETLQQVKRLLGDRASKILADESREMKYLQAGCVVSDIPATAFRLANKAGIPGIAVTNFSWDWIYEAWIQKYPEAEQVTQCLRSDYELCDLLLLLPYSEKLPAFKKFLKTPMLGRKAALKKDVTRHRLGLADDHRPVVLLSFGGMGFKNGDLPMLKNSGDFRFLSTFPVENSVVKQLQPLHFYNITYPDLVSLADVVVTKPGYGIVSECAVNQTRMLYTDRGAFREYQAILNELPYWNCSAYISRDRLSKGNWKNALEDLMNLDPSCAPGAAEAQNADGAGFAAENILRYYDLRRTAR